MIGYVIGGMALALAGVSGYAYMERSANAVLIEREALTSAQLETCGGRLEAVLRDVRSDNEIDNLDLRNFDIPPEWLRGGDAVGPERADSP